ncbi:hypothetical protein AB0J83_32570 [Actinoplanes sp. NPDC049596]|uniref:hypothetical protein n=1 Tax=unclassified Actinoplanes TaxID=2626549 RepID=UPI003420CEC3
MNAGPVVDDRDGVAVVSLDKGKVNALDLDLLHEITAAFAELDRRREAGRREARSGRRARPGCRMSLLLGRGRWPGSRPTRSG